MKPALLLEHVGGYFLANRAGTISLLPTLPTPSLLAHLGKSCPTLPGTDRLQQPHHLPNRVLRRNAQNHMHVVFLYVQLFDLKPVMRRSLQKSFSYALPDRSLPPPLAVLGSPHQMIAGVVDTVAGTPNCHAPTFQDWCCLWQQAFLLPALPGGASKGDFS